MVDVDVLEGAETDKKNENPVHLSAKILLLKNIVLVKTLI